ncbi:N-acetylmuramoyl-L-alanine amidase [Elioraea rosea]|uniref:N-acetylmuramoyl-L-alanine amidase n=1 Tax=Elioraea rosea TaxID=2492390 RepID=UPI0011868E12|nr:N-acetylmuramoyl-L-alanine amidase [Elioraea rosea]
MRRGFGRRFVVMAGVRATLVLPAATLATRALATIQATGATLTHEGATTELALATGEAPRFSLFTLANPPRVVIDLPGLAWAGGEPPAGAGLVRGVRVGLNRPGVTRVVLDLARPVAVARAEIAGTGRGATLLIALNPASQSIFLRQTAGNDQAQAVQEAAARPPPPPPRVPLVMIDPGHGGRDPGAIGARRTHEKHITLSAAAELRRVLERGGKVRVAMTRTRDVFVPLPDRVRAAQKAGADLFVSIHADALDDRSVRGASVYTLSERASDPLAERVARNENGADRFAGPAFADVSPEAAQILISLVRRDTLNGSARMARATVANLSREVPMLPNSHRFAGFMVLKAPDIPSVLVEMGFISNRTDEALLRRPEHRRVLAAAMGRAIEGWFGEVGAIQTAG